MTPIWLSKGRSVAFEIDEHTRFIGREYEWQQLEEIGRVKKSSIVVAYGRRRVGKTELLEQVFRKRNIFKFEGIEGKNIAQQIKQALRQLAKYTNEPMYAKLELTQWSDFFELLIKHVESEVVTVYFEEIQWLANYQGDFISELKFYWDNYFRKNKQLLLILCGSSPSFIINKIIHSKALYNRSQHTFPLQEFNLVECQKFFPKKSNREVLEAYLAVGGIPEYLNYLNKKSSVFLSVCEQAFSLGGALSQEYEKIFTSSMSGNKYYKAIIEYLSKGRFATREEIAKHLQVNTGGSLTDVLTDLEVCGFIGRYTPYNLEQSSTLARYCIVDQYLQFYYKFIKPKEVGIQAGEFNKNPTAAINLNSYDKWSGFAFERMCRKHHAVIARILGFGAIQYTSGAFYNRASDKEDAGFQIDLMFDRADRVLTICEVRHTRKKVGVKVIEEFERKLELFPNKKNKTIERVLISSHGAELALMDRAYFDRVIDLDMLMSEIYWS